MKVIITGAQFGNKGAQSLLFNVVDQLRKHYGNVDIYFLTLDGNNIIDKENYRFETVHGIYFYEKFHNTIFNKVFLIITENIKRILKKKYYTLDGTKRIKEIYQNSDVLIDVSGYALSSKWTLKSNKQFLNSIFEAQKLGLKTIIMPQSFGPFDYKENQEMMDDLIKKLKDVDLIFAREKEGYDLLTSKYSLTNVKLSPDLVLQNKEIDIKNILKSSPDFKELTLQNSKNNVCIIPNTQTINHGDSISIYQLYRKMIFKLVEIGKNVYIFNHANDSELCKKIYHEFADNKSVYLLNNDLNAMEYEKFVRQFDYIICSRYHGIVHAYKQQIPAIILGWAIKYMELAKHFFQEEYVFDITNKDFDEETIMRVIEKMNLNFREESCKIYDALTEIQKQTCFDDCWKIIDDAQTFVLGR